MLSGNNAGPVLITVTINHINPEIFIEGVLVRLSKLMSASGFSIELETVFTIYNIQYTECTHPH